jgi:hypothetical protein
LSLKPLLSTLDKSSTKESKPIRQLIEKWLLSPP